MGTETMAGNGFQVPMALKAARPALGRGGEPLAHPGRHRRRGLGLATSATTSGPRGRRSPTSAGTADASCRCGAEATGAPGARLLRGVFANWLAGLVRHNLDRLETARPFLTDPRSPTQVERAAVSERKGRKPL